MKKGLKRRIFERDNYMCRYCGYSIYDEYQSRTLMVDHVIPKVEGGSDNEENLVTACHLCNHIGCGKPFFTFFAKKSFISKRLKGKRKYSRGFIRSPQFSVFEDQQRSGV